MFLQKHIFIVYPFLVKLIVFARRIHLLHIALFVFVSNISVFFLHEAGILANSSEMFWNIAFLHETGILANSSGMFWIQEGNRWYFVANFLATGPEPQGQML